jgi:hypothetical protein
VPQAVEGGVDVHGSGAHFFEQSAQLVLIHKKFQDSSGGESLRGKATAFPPPAFARSRVATEMPPVPVCGSVLRW